MLRRRRTRDEVVALCNEVGGFLGRMEAREAEGFYLRQAEALRVEEVWLARRRIYRRIYSASNSGAGGMGDMFVVTPDGVGDVPAAEGFQRSLSALLRATRAFP
jgi:hypothetical protein